MFNTLFITATFDKIIGGKVSSKELVSSGSNIEMSGAGVRLLQTKPLNTVDTKFIQALVKFEEKVEGVNSILT